MIHETAQVSKRAIIGNDVNIWNWVQIEDGVQIGDGCIIAKGVYVQGGVCIGKNVKIGNNVSIFRGVEIQDSVFVGPHVCFTNDRKPRATNPDGSKKGRNHWIISKTIVEEGASIGANSTIICGIRIGKGAMVGAGSVVTKDIGDNEVWFGNPAKKRSQSPTPISTNLIPLAKPIIGEEEKKAVMDVLDSGMLAQGCKVKELEESFAKFCGTKYAIAVNSGTATLHTALYAIGIKAGDEVLTVPFTFVATANTILMQNAKPVFVDVDEDTFNIDPNKIEEKITPKTKAIIAVDLYGQPADYEKINAIAKKHNLKIIEDSCQAHNAEYNGVKTGALGDIGCFSLYSTKNITCAEGGIITTNNEKYAELCRRFRHHGRSYDIGYNYRMTDIQAAIAIEQLKKIEDFTRRRIQNAKILSEGLSDIKGITTPKINPKVKHVFHQYTIKVGNGRDKLMGRLKRKGIGCAIFYPKPLHLHPHFSKLGYKAGDFPVSEKLSKEVLSLPVHPSLSKKHIEYILEVFK